MTTAATADPNGVSGSSGFIRAVGWLLVLAGLGLAGLRFAGASPADDGPEGMVGALALGAPVMGSGALAWMSLRDRPALMLPAAVVLVPLSFLSFAGVTLPLLVPAAMLFVGYRRRRRLVTLPGARVAVTLWVVLAFFVGAVVVLFAHDDPRAWTTVGGGGSTSDVITWAESTISLVLSATALVAGWHLSAPEPDRP